MILVVFKTHLRPGAAREAYAKASCRMHEVLETTPGFISIKGFFAADDEGKQRLSLLDCATRAVEPILDAGEAEGSAPRFIDAHHLAVEGGAAALVLSFNDPL